MKSTIENRLADIAFACAKACDPDLGPELNAKRIEFILNDYIADSVRLDCLNGDVRVAKMSDGWNAWRTDGWTTSQSFIHKDIRRAIDGALDFTNPFTPEQCKAE